MSGKGYKALSEEILGWFFKTNPVMATAVGVHDYDSELGDFTAEAIQAQNEQARRYLAQIQALDPAALAPEERIDRELIVIQLETGVKLEDALHQWRQNPGYGDIAVMGAFLLLFREFAPLEQRLESLLARLKQVPVVLAQGKANLTDPVKVFAETAVETLRGGLMFFQGLVPTFIAQASSPALRQSLEDANAKAILAMQDYLASVKAAVPKGSPNFAIGQELFDYLLRRRHLLPYDSGTLFARGQELFTETYRAMSETARQIDRSKTMWEVVEDLKREHPKAGDLVPSYRRAMIAAKEWVVEKGIVDLPAGEDLVVEETPTFQRPIIPYAAYMAPAAFEKVQTGRFFVTPVDQSASAEHQEQQLRDHNTYAIPIKAIHEAYPGHHLQLCWANANPSPIRKINDSTLFIEGWAFYCEELAERLGLLAGPKSRLIRLKDQLWRAGRVVLDAGLHARGMTIDEAVGYFVEKVHLERPNALAEVRRYAQTPTQPMSYLIGKIEIVRLSDDYKSAREDDFDLRKFHNDLLAQGNLPPAMLRRVLLD